MVEIRHNEILIFPCGYKIERYSKVNYGIFDISNFNFRHDDYPKCPIHGDKCKK